MHISEKIDLVHRFTSLDTTSFSVAGAYDEQTDEQTITLTHGYSKDHRPDLKQVVLELVTSHDGGIPLFFVLDRTLASLKDDPAFATLVPGFEKNGDQIQKISDKPDFSKLFTAGGIISTPIDLVKWQHALYQRHIIPLKLLHLMTHQVIQKTGFAFYDGEGSLYAGYGVDILDNGKTKLYQHCGGTAGYQSKISYDPKTQIGIINLSNIMEENPPIFAFSNRLRAILSNIDEVEDAK